MPVLRRVCPSCLAALPVITPARCPRCGRPARRLFTPKFLAGAAVLLVVAAAAWAWASWNRP